MRHLRVAAALALTVSLTATLAPSWSRAAPPKVPLEIWGLEAGDEARIDDQPVTVRGGPPRPFLGDPAADDAPVLTEVAPGKREITLLRQGCAPETFTVVVEGSQKKAIVVTKAQAAKCSLPEVPARH